MKLCVSKNLHSINSAPSTQKLGSLYKRHTKSDNGCSYWPQKLKRKQSKPTEENMETTNSRLPVWIVNHSNEVDSKRFLIEWLSASVQDVPLVVYQSSKGPSMYQPNNFNHQIYLNRFTDTL